MEKEVVVRLVLKLMQDARKELSKLKGPNGTCDPDVAEVTNHLIDAEAVFGAHEQHGRAFKCLCGIDFPNVESLNYHLSVLGKI